MATVFAPNVQAPAVKARYESGICVPLLITLLITLLILLLGVVKDKWISEGQTF